MKYSSRTLVEHVVRDVDDERRAALERNYCKLLRRAMALGWERAKAEYLPHERASGRVLTDIMSDLAMFEDLNLAARQYGFDPIEMQRRTDLYQHIIRPVAIVGSALSVVAMAVSGTEVTPAVLVAVLTCWLSLRTSKSLLSIT